jgi:murein DD-endopeptidase MepM/ murein hydrolase activator NlpD
MVLLSLVFSLALSTAHGGKRDTEAGTCVNCGGKRGRSTRARIPRGKIENGCYGRPFTSKGCPAQFMPDGNIYGKCGGHKGIDFDGERGAAIKSRASGRVIYAGRDRAGYGNRVIIDHGGGRFTTYSHLHTISVRVGASVSGKQPIGTMGNTGASAGTHLHLEEIRNGVFVDPGGSGTCYEE